MPLSKNRPLGIFLEAEVPSNRTSIFESKYQEATGDSVSPGNPPAYKIQDNKWGMELRIYFNDPGIAIILMAMGVHVEGPRQGYMSDKYQFRVNNRELWWNLVESHGLTLGKN